MVVDGPKEVGAYVARHLECIRAVSSRYEQLVLVDKHFASDGLGPILLAVVVAITGLTASILVAKILQLDPGFAAGLMSGALTQSAAMGTATDAVNALPLSEADRALLVAHIAVADAVCYIFGYAGVIVFCTVIAPALLKIDLRTEALKLEQALGMKRATPGLASAWRKFELRAYRLAENSPLTGLTVAAAEARVPEHRPFIQRLRQRDRIFEAASDMTLRASDVIAISGPREVMVELVGPRADEVEDRELLDLPVLAADVLLMSPKVGAGLLPTYRQKNGRVGCICGLSAAAVRNSRLRAIWPCSAATPEPRWRSTISSIGSVSTQVRLLQRWVVLRRSYSPLELARTRQSCTSGSQKDLVGLGRSWILRVTGSKCPAEG